LPGRRARADSRCLARVRPPRAVQRLLRAMFDATTLAPQSAGRCPIPPSNWSTEAAARIRCAARRAVACRRVARPIAGR
jgi:hypothetical protein